VFVVGHLGDWKPAAEVLFESESLCWDTKKGRVKGEKVARCITTRSATNLCSETGNFVIPHCADTFPTLLSSTAGVSRPGNAVTEHETYIAFGWQNSSSQGMSVDTISPTLDKSKTPATMQNMAVRRITPIECERLQGFPDNYTNIKEDCPDGARYKALGNSMAVPVMRWIGERINQYEQRGVEKHL
jgi:DNA (cytosine-5)-methyltransferase 1